MKKLLVICTFLFFVSFPFLQTRGAPTQYKLYKTYDKFKNKTFEGIVIVKNNSFKSEVYFSYEGTIPDQKIEDVYFNLLSRSNGWRYLKNHELFFLVDDGLFRYQHGNKKWFENRDTLGGSYVQEDLTALIPVSDFIKIAAGKKLEMQYGTEETGKWKNENIAKIKLLADRITEINNSLPLQSVEEPKEGKE